jgi:hypothetical protein
LNVCDDDDKEATETESFEDADNEEDVVESADSKEHDFLMEEAEECHQKLIAALVQGIARVTEACRNNHNFENGFLYTGDSAPLKNSKAKLGAPLMLDSLLWRAGLALETRFGVINMNSHFVVPVTDEAVSDFACDNRYQLSRSHVAGAQMQPSV